MQEGCVVPSALFREQISLPLPIAYAQRSKQKDLLNVESSFRVSCGKTMYLARYVDRNFWRALSEGDCPGDVMLSARVRMETRDRLQLRFQRNRQL